MRTREELILGDSKTSYPIDSVKWKGSISSGIPSSIIDSRFSQISGSAEVVPDEHLSRAVDESLYPELRAGLHGQIVAYEGDKVISTTAIMLTKVSYTWDKVSVEFSSDFLSFSNRVRVAPQAREMPEGWNSSPEQTDPWARDLGRVFTQCSPLLGVFHAFRAAGFHAVPDISDDTIVDLPMQYSAVTNEWDERSGHTYSSTAAFNKNAGPSMHFHSDGRTSIGDCEVWATGSPARDKVIRATQGHFICYPQAYTSASGPVGIALIYGGGNTFSVTSYPDGNLIVSGTTVADTEMGIGTISGESVVLFSCSQTAGKWWVEANGKKISGNFKPVKTNNGYNQDFFTGIKVFAQNGSTIHGVQVREGYSSSHYLGTTVKKPMGNFERTLKVDSPLVMWGGGSPFTPGIKDESAREVLNEISEALCGTWWIDEDNVAHYKDMKSMLEGGVSREIPFDDNVGSYTIEEIDTSSRDAIDVSYSTVAYSKYRRARVQLWQGNGDRLEAGDQVAYELAPANNEEWIAPDFNIRRFDTWGSMMIFMDQEGSWILDYNPSNNKKNTRKYRVDTQIVSPWAATLTVHATGEIMLKLVEGPIPYTNLDTPVVRGRGRMIRTETLLHIGTTSAAAPYHHDAQRWVTQESVAKEIGNYLRTGLPDQKPSLSEFTMPYTPDLRLGEVVQVTAGASAGRSRKIVILGFEHNPESHTTKIDCLEIESYKTNFTWAEAEAEAKARGAAGKYPAIESERRKHKTKWSEVEDNQKAYSKGV